MDSDCDTLLTPIQKRRPNKWASFSLMNYHSDSCSLSCYAEKVENKLITMTAITLMLANDSLHLLIVWRRYLIYHR